MNDRHPHCMSPSRPARSHARLLSPNPEFSRTLSQHEWFPFSDWFRRECGLCAGPFLIAQRVHLSPVEVMFAIVAFGYLFGLIGLLMTVPLAAIWCKSPASGAEGYYPART